MGSMFGQVNPAPAGPIPVLHGAPELNRRPCRTRFCDWGGRNERANGCTARPFDLVELRYQRPSTVMLMRETPCPVMPILSADALERSMTRPTVSGPRTMMRTSTERPLRKCLTRTRVPNGSVLWAASWRWDRISHRTQGAELASSRMPSRSDPSPPECWRDANGHSVCHHPHRRLE
jgi:hypothetical protein